MTRTDLAARVAELQSSLKKVRHPTAIVYASVDAAKLDDLLSDLMRDYLAALAELDEAREFSDTQMAGHGETMRELKAAEAELARIRSAIDVQPVTVADEDERPCTDCGDTGVTFQTERFCTCDAGRALAKGDDHE